MAGRPPNPNGNPAWVKGGASPNPSGKTLPERLAARSLAIVLRERLDQVDLFESLWTIYSGRDPFLDPRPDTTNGPVPAPAPVDWATRRWALTTLLERAHGMPMQAVMMRAEIEARSRVLDNATDVINVGELDPRFAMEFEAILLKALEAPRE